MAVDKERAVLFGRAFRDLRSEPSDVLQYLLPRSPFSDYTSESCAISKQNYCRNDGGKKENWKVLWTREEQQSSFGGILFPSQLNPSRRNIAPIPTSSSALLSARGATFNRLVFFTRNQLSASTSSHHQPLCPRVVGEAYNREGLCQVNSIQICFSIIN